MKRMLAAVVALTVSATAMAQYQDVTVNGAGEPSRTRFIPNGPTPTTSSPA